MSEGRLRWALRTVGVGLALFLGACNGPIPGSENVRLLRNQIEVRNAEPVASQSGSTDPKGVHDLSVKAKNFAFKHHADIVVVNLQPITPKKIQYTIQAWKSQTPTE